MTTTSGTFLMDGLNTGYLVPQNWETKYSQIKRRLGVAWDRLRFSFHLLSMLLCTVCIMVLVSHCLLLHLFSLQIQLERARKKREILWIDCQLPQQDGGPHLPEFPHFHANRPQVLHLYVCKYTNLQVCLHWIILIACGGSWVCTCRY